MFIDIDCVYVYRLPSSVGRALKCEIKDCGSRIQITHEIYFISGTKKP